MRKGSILIGILGLILGASLFAGCSTAALPGSSASEPDVPLRLKSVWAGSYKDDIQPIFDRYCVDCHGTKRAENGLRLDSYDAVMAGTQYGAVVAPGSSSASSLIFVIDGTASQEIQMPHEARKLSRNRITNIRAWIDAGAQQ